jgi:hypothetical protein
MIEITPENRTKKLREFGFILAGGLTLIFGIIGPWLRGHQAPTWLWVVNSLLVSLALIAPKSLNKIEKLWHKFGHMLGAINSRIILTLVFYILITPMGTLMKLNGYDPLTRNTGKNKNSYQIKSKQRPAKHMIKPW